jgi:hypothetical protein
MWLEKTIADEFPYRTPAAYGQRSQPTTVTGIHHDPPWLDEGKGPAFDRLATTLLSMGRDMSLQAGEDSLRFHIERIGRQRPAQEAQRLPGLPLAQRQDRQQVQAAHVCGIAGQ